MAPRKAAKNAYFYYVLEFQRIEKAKGNDLSVPQASALASDGWKNLSEVAKQKYKSLAAQAKDGEKAAAKPPMASCGKNGYTAQGLPLSQLEREQNEKAREIQNMKDMISTMLKDAKATGGIDKLVFHLIHMNMFYADLPCEVAVSKFSISDGIIETYHSLIKIPKLPLGAAYEAKSVADKVHGLPLPPNAIGEENLYFILRNILDFVSHNNKVVIFCRPNDIETIEQGLAYLEDEAGSFFSRDHKIILADFVELFHQAQKLVLRGTPSGELTYAGAKIILERDIFDSVVKGCDYHDEYDRNLTCSEAIVKRQAYQFIDTFVNSFGNEPEPESHFPALLLKEDKTEPLLSTLSKMTLSETTAEEALFQIDETNLPALSLDETNPFFQDLQKEDESELLQQIERQQLDNDSDFDLESRFGDTSSNFSKFQQLLDCVRNNSR